MSTTERKKFKKIDGMLNEDCEEIRDQTGLCEMAKEYFNKLFSFKEINHNQFCHLFNRG